jgi:hypothetical protein
MRKPNEDNWLEMVMNALEELQYLWDAELVQDNEEAYKREIEGKLEELRSLVDYLNKTN